MRKYGILLSIFFLGRMSLLVWYRNTVFAKGVGSLQMIGTGLLEDLFIASLLLLLPASLELLLTHSRKFRQPAVSFFFFLVTVFLIFLEVATIPFMNQFGVRPNYIFVGYISYPQEIFGMLYGAYKTELCICLAALIFTAVMFMKFRAELFPENSEPSPKKRLIPLTLVIVLLLLSGGSQFLIYSRGRGVHGPIIDRRISQIWKNSLFSLGKAVIHQSHRTPVESSKAYAGLTEQESYRIVKQRLGITGTSSWNSMKRPVNSSFKRHKNPNLVIILEESFDFELVEAIGGKKGLTPEFSSLQNQGIFFSNLYANGTRSVRALAAMTSGILPVPGVGVVKGRKSQRDFFTIGRMLKPMGYHSMYFAAGKASFANMKEWLKANGFDEIIDKHDMSSTSFSGTWGVCDEDLFNEAHKRFTKLNKENEPFLALLFTSTNHAPYDFPKDRIDLVPDVPVKSAENAVKYADYALGKFISRARKHEYYKDTIFVIAGDHAHKMYGGEMVPVKLFHIPGLILGGDIKAREYDGISSHPDLLATALDLMGMDFEYPILGNSIFSPQKSSFALLKYHSSYALLSGKSVGILHLGKEPLTFSYIDGKLSRTEQNPQLEKDVLAFAITLGHLYEQRLYK